MTRIRLLLGTMAATIVLLAVALAYLIGRQSAPSIEPPEGSTTPSAPPYLVKETTTGKQTLRNTSDGDSSVANLRTNRAPAPIWNAGDVSGTCDVSLNGRRIMRGRCDGVSRRTEIVMTAQRDGCTVELHPTSSGATLKIYAYRNSCGSDDLGLWVEEDTPLGDVTVQNGCLINASARICFRLRG